MGEKDELGQIERKEGEKWERAQKEAHAGHPHIAHSYLIWLSFPCFMFYDSKQPKVLRLLL